MADTIDHDRESIRSRLAARAKAIGVRAAAREVGLSREALLGIIAGMSSRDGTWALARERLRALSSASESGR